MARLTIDVASPAPGGSVVELRGYCTKAPTEAPPYQVRAYFNGVQQPTVLEATASNTAIGWYTYAPVTYPAAGKVTIAVEATKHDGTPWAPRATKTITLT